MKKLSFLLVRSFALILLTVLTGTVLMAQSPHLPPTGTSNEYSISSVTDWNDFVEDVNHGYCDYAGKTIKLMNDIPTAAEIEAGTTAVTTMAGYYSETLKRPFRGTFNGDNHTLTVNYTAVGENPETHEVEYTAPFVCTEGARINKLHVAGTINGTAGHAAGVIGINYNKTTRINGAYNIISVNITGGGSYCAGLVVEALASVEMSSCVYNGQIVAGSNSAGLCAIGYSGGTKIIESQFTPADGSSIAGGANFVNGDLSTYSKEFYYTYKVGSSIQGVRAYKTYAAAPSESPFTYCKELYDGNNYYVEGMATINGLNASYYENYVQTVGLNYNVTFEEPDVDAITLDPSSYTATVKNSSDETVAIASIEPGNYTLVIEGNEGFCKGKITANFAVTESIFDYGCGTEDDPYQIRSITDWVKFAHEVNTGHSFIEEYLKLTTDITVAVKTNSDNARDTIVGVMTSQNTTFTEDKWFSGTFDGDWHTITFNVGRSKEAPFDPSNNVSPNAPFRVIDGATIKNLTVEGTIYSTKKYNSGLIGYAFSAKTGNPNYILNCTSSIVIDCSKISGGNDDCSSAGFLAENKDGTPKSSITFENCVFDGKILKGDLSSGNKCGGFVSYNSGVSLTFNNCTMDGEITLTGGKKDNFSRNGTPSFTEAYYTKNKYKSGSNYQGTQAPTSEPSDKFVKKYIYDNGATTYYVPGAEITDIETVYSYTGEAVVITPITVLYYGRTLTRGVDYDIKIDGTVVPTETTPTISGTPAEIEGIHTVTVEGKGSYAGKKTMNVMVENFDTWAKVKEALADASEGVKHITLSADITPDNPHADEVLEVNGTVVLNLNGHTIDRHLFTGNAADVPYTARGQVIRVNSGATLTIDGPGTIKGGFNKAENDSNNQDAQNDAGGIYNMGNLTLNNVTIRDNKCIKYRDINTNDAATARGGGIYTGQGSSFTMTGGKVTYNVAKGGGGGVYCYQPASFSMTGVEISNNESESKGGGLRIRTTNSVEAQLTNCTIQYCRATETDLSRSSDGGGIYMQEGKLRMENCTIGGCTILNPGTPEADTISHCNQSAFAGAGFYQGGGTTYAKDCTISYNSAYTEHDKMYGGGICLCKGTYTMDGGVITNNHSYMDGGGVYIVSGATFNVLGKILIDDNFRTRKGAIPEDTENNTYTSGNAVINVIGELDPDTRIHITGHGFGGVYTSGLEEFANEANFVTDGKYRLLNIMEDDLDEITLVPYIWNETSTWSSSSIPTTSTDVKIDRAIELKSGETGYAQSIEFVNGKIILEDGAQLICNDNKTGTPIEIHVQKSITAAENHGDDTYGWYIVSVPMDEVKVYDEFENGTNFVTKTAAYDLMLYDEPTHWWWKYNESKKAFEIKNTSTWAVTKSVKNTQKGRGYIYRNEKDRNLEFAGKMNIGDVEYTFTRKGDKLTGFHLIGNPYIHNVYKGEGGAIPNSDVLASGYYTLSAAGAWEAKEDNKDVIGVCQGILVKAINTGTITMTNTTEGGPSSKAQKKNISFTVSNSKYEDAAYAVFDEGYGLDKIGHINDDIPLIYIRHDDESYAIAVMEEDTKKFDLCFEAKTTGKYTLSVKPEGEFGYLHIIDRLTGENIDMLKESEYSFIASITDKEDRFLVLLREGGEFENDEFAYQNGRDIVVSGEGQLQVFDVMGRMVATQYINGVDTWRASSVQTGVYILRLNGKTQKIIIK